MGEDLLKFAFSLMVNQTETKHINNRLSCYLTKMTNTQTKKSFKRGDNMINTIKGVSNKVEYALTHYGATRDSDAELIARICNSYIDVKRASAFELLSQLSKGAIPPLESITRARRKLQELNPSLRGNSYKGRKDAAEAVRIGINN
jgi:hypothetical protein